MAKAFIALFSALFAAVALFYGHSVIALICVGFAFLMLLAASLRTPHRRGGRRRSREGSVWFTGAGSDTHHHHHDRVDSDSGWNSSGDSGGSDSGGSDSGGGGGSD
jgi:uncharacterized membrane protein YgcG